MDNKEKKARTFARYSLALLCSQIIWFIVFVVTTDLQIFFVMILFFLLSLTYSILSLAKKTSPGRWVLLVMHGVVIAAFVYLVYLALGALGAAYAPGG